MLKYKIELEYGARPLSHELDTADILVSYGNVLFLKPLNLDKIHTPDIVWLNLRWEIKAPLGDGKNLIHNTISRATRQSENIIIDLRRFKGVESNAIRQIRNIVTKYKKIKRLKIIMRSSELIDIKK